MQTTETRIDEKAAARCDVGELLDAIADPGLTEAYLRKHAITEEEMRARAETVAERLATGVANVNCV